MSEVVVYNVGGKEVLVEAWEVNLPKDSAGVELISRPGGLGDAARKLDESLELLLPAAASVLEGVKGLKPTKTEVEFGIKLSVEAGAILAKAGGEANFTVKLTWDTAEAAAEQG